MEITLNNSVSQIEANSSLNDLIQIQLGEKTNGVAIAINQVVIPKTDWNATILQPNDSILIIKATQGG